MKICKKVQNNTNYEMDILSLPSLNHVFNTICYRLEYTFGVLRFI